MRQDHNVEREISRVDTGGKAIRASNRDQELGFLWGKISLLSG